MTGIDIPSVAPASGLGKVKGSRAGGSLARAKRIALRFAIPTPVEAFDFPYKGNINQHTYLVTGGCPPDRREYLLQRINTDVFTQPQRVMAAMIASIQAQNAYLAAHPRPQGEEWEAVCLVPTLQGALYLELPDERGVSVWRLMELIPDAHTFKSLSEIPDQETRLHVAEEAGRGLALYSDLTSGMECAGLSCSLPGHRDIRVYYQQFFSVLQENRTLEQAEPYLPRDSVVRESTQKHFLVHIPATEYRERLTDPHLQRFIAMVRKHAEFGMTLTRALDAGTVRTVAIHGDTKLDNFLFSTRTGRVKALVDLDTIMPHTWLADWGDMVRSLVNVAGEKETDLNRVQVDREVFRAIARGFLTTAREVTPAEVALMVEAVQVTALELGVRFLADYLRGDSYFRLGPGDPIDLNKTRAQVQLTLCERLLEETDTLKACIAEFAQ